MRAERAAAFAVTFDAGPAGGEGLLRGIYGESVQGPFDVAVEVAFVADCAGPGAAGRLRLTSGTAQRGSGPDTVVVLHPGGTGGQRRQGSSTDRTRTAAVDGRTAPTGDRGPGQRRRGRRRHGRRERGSAGRTVSARTGRVQHAAGRLAGDGRPRWAERHGTGGERTVARLAAAPPPARTRAMTGPGRQLATADRADRVQCARADGELHGDGRFGDEPGRRGVGTATGVANGRQRQSPGAAIRRRGGAARRRGPGPRRSNGAGRGAAPSETARWSEPAPRGTTKEPGRRRNRDDGAAAGRRGTRRPGQGSAARLVESRDGPRADARGGRSSTGSAEPGPGGRTWAGRSSGGCR